MEHHISQNSPPVHAAGTDPAFVPGLPPPRPAEAEESPPVPADAVPDTRAAPEPTAEAEAAVAEEEPRPVADGPVFEVSDRRGSITVDSTGVTFRLDDETAGFGWPEIGAVEMSVPRFGRRLTVTVHTTRRRSYDAVVEAPNRSLPKQWATELDAVLDSYFEDTGTTD
ncbi:hypothetical protein I5Q34_27720 [Streptomyces sp. AV19]|uniref:hypothetical protein n=1 Tax=Streptomyces sp. AV19 TaxID=2793068 RepID=UPI0018FE6703|nr:hypothetical protein [Streptomyces sp. AV19]MBH1938015.1 hypothetical protein [Streptomyces sp. AV19]MDG4536630.1 hypothetical protein [Streptomyces sp. AV19]